MEMQMGHGWPATGRLLVKRAVLGRAKGWGKTEFIAAVVLFLGTTRELTNGRQTVALDYEAYPAMAEKVLGEIEADVRGRWPVGEADGADQLFCGARKDAERVYCPAHSGTAHVASKLSGSNLARSLRRHYA